MLEYVAIDCSGSTSYGQNKELYWPRVSKYIKTIESENITYLFWSNMLENETNNRNKALEFCSHYKDNAMFGTDPSVFVDKLKKDKEGIKLTIFTDGEIPQKYIHICDTSLKIKGIIIQDLTIYYCGVGKMNLSVSTPFTTNDRAPKEGGMRFSGYINDEQLMQNKVTIKAEHIVDQLKACKDNLELFLTRAPELLDQLKIDKLTLSDDKSKVRIKQEVVDLQKNLMEIMARDARENTGKEILKLVNSLKAKHQEDALKQLEELLGKLLKESIKEKINQIKEYFEKMLIAISKSEDYNFMQLVDKNKRAAPIERSEIKDLETCETSLNKCKFTCPITINQDIPMLPIRGGSTYMPILKDLDKGYTRLIISNPLITLSDRSLVSIIRQRLDLPIGTNTLKQLKDQKKSPMTRQDCSSYISAGTDPIHLDFTNYAIADIFSSERNYLGIKLAGVRGLYLAVIYFVAEERTPHLKPDPDNNNDDDKLAFMNAFKTNLLYRLNMDQTNLCLSGSPADGQLVKVPLGLAIWYCVQSLKLKNVPTRIDILTKYHLKLLDLLEYPYSKEWTQGRIALHQVFKVMMREEKSQPASHLRNWLRCLYQNSIRLTDGTIIFIDGESTLYQDLASFRVVVNLVDETTITEDRAYLYQLPLLDSNNKQTTLKLIDTRKLDEQSDEYDYSIPISTLLGLEKLLDKRKTVVDVKIPDKDKLILKIPEPKETYINQGENTNPSRSFTELLNKALNKLIENIESRGQTSDLNDEEKREFGGKIKNIKGIKEHIKNIIYTQMIISNKINIDKKIDEEIDEEIDKRMRNTNGFIYLGQESSIKNELRNLSNINKLTSWDNFIKIIMQDPVIKKEFESRIVCEQNRSQLIRYIKDSKYNKKFIKYLVAPKTVVKFTKVLKLKLGPPLFLEKFQEFILEKFQEFILETSPLFIKYLKIDKRINEKIKQYSRELNTARGAQITPNKKQVKINESEMPSGEDLIKSLLENNNKNKNDVFPENILALAKEVISERSKIVANVQESSEEVITQKSQVAGSNFFSHGNNNKSGSGESTSCQSVMQLQR